MTEAAEITRRVVSNSGFSNPLTLPDVYVEAAAHLEVYADTTLMSVGTHYTIADLLDAGGVSVMITATGLALAPTNWVIRHDPPLDQSYDLSVGGQFGLAYENAIDALTRRIQAMSERINLSLIVAIDYEGAAITLPTAEADKALKWNSAGTALENSTYDPDSLAAAAAASAAAAAADLLLTNADVVLTNADVVLTHADVVLTGADVDSTNADVLLTAADVVLTGADVDSTNADVVLTNADVVSTNADAAAAAASAAAAIVAMMEWYGPWVTSTAFVLNDVVEEAGSSYICVEAHTSGVFATDLAAVKWELVAEKGDPGTGDFLADGSVPMTGDLDVDGQNIDSVNSLYMAEQAAADVDIADSVQWWALTGGKAMFTGDDGVDYQLNRLVQVVHTQDGEVATTTTTMPPDDTIPQNTEGAEFMTLPITPKDANNKLLVEVVATFAHTVTNDRFVMALFQDTTAGALSATCQRQKGGNNAETTMKLIYEMTAGTISPTTFKMRAGMGTAGTLTFNGASSARILAGLFASTITITELAA